MNLLEQLETNKGTVSSALGKKLASDVLSGNKQILDEAISLASFEIENKKAKNIRAGAAKIIEIVGEKQPILVAPSLDKLLLALEAPEPQTRWMIIRTMGFCAIKNEKIAEKAIKFAEAYIEQKEGLCIKSSADLFLGDYGSISPKNAMAIFPLLEKSLQHIIINEEDWLMEAFLKIFNNLGSNEKEIILSFARINLDAPKKSSQKRAQKLIKLGFSLR